MPMGDEAAPKITAKSNWKAKQNEVRDAISFGTLTERLKSELPNLLENHTFVTLQRPDREENTPCEIHLKLEDPTLKLINVAIVSEAKSVELYGSMGEYLETEAAENLDPTSEVLLSWVQTDLKPTSELTMKFVRILGTDTFWLYGLRLIVEKAAPLPGSRINYRNVSDRLSSSRVPITEKAERCKKFLEQYTTLTNSVSGAQPDAFTLAATSEEQCLSRLRALGPARPPNDMTSLFNDLKQHVDLTVKQMECRLMDNLNQKFLAVEKKQNEILDKVTQLMSEIATQK